MQLLLHMHLARRLSDSCATHHPVHGREQESNMARTVGHVGTKHLQQLLERINAHEDPITRSALVRFLHHPDGPIIPNACVEVRRLPNDCITDAHRRTALDLAVAPDGTPIVAVVLRGDYQIALLAGDRRFTLEQMQTRNWEGEAIEGWSVELLGCSADGAPAARLTCVVHPGHHDEYHASRFVIGDANVGNADHMVVAIILRDGSFLTARGTNRDYRWQSIYRGDREIIPPLERAYETLHEGTDGRLFAHWGKEFGILGENPWKFAKPYRHFVDFVDTPNGTRFLCVDGEGFDYSVRSSHQGLTPADEECHGSHRYLRHWTTLPDRRVAFVTNTTRDDLKCWMVDGALGMGFERVSALFTRDERRCYWGALDRHLYCMELLPTPIPRTRRRE